MRRGTDTGKLKIRPISDTGVLRWVQLRDQLVAAIATAVLSPGDRLPTLRDMSMDAHLDMNTVKRAYDDLQQRGLVTIQHGRGAFVTSKQPDQSAIGPRESILNDLAAHVIEMAETLGFTGSELADAIQLHTKDTSAC